MPKTKNRWGLVLFFCALAIAGTGITLSFIYQPEGNPALYKKVLPAIGLILSCTSFLVGHFSYPRVQNLKVYLIGYLVGLIGLGYFLLYKPPFKPFVPPAPANFTHALFILAFVNIIAALALPSYLRYRLTKQLTFIIAGFETVLILIFRFVPSSLHWTRILRFESITDFAFWTGFMWFGIVLWLSIWLLRKEFYLGGIFAGTALLYLLARHYAPLHANPQSVQCIMMVQVPFYLQIGSIVHWFFRMEHRISYDPLLHIYNRNYCSRVITEQSNLNTLPPFAVAMLDIDHFKKVNDTYGHQAGDHVLYNTAQTVCREVIPDGTVCRYGGEELAVFFPQKVTKDVVPVMEKVRKAVEKMKTTFKKKNIKVTLSIGISHRYDKTQTIIDVIHTADKALYKAKKGGRNQVKHMKISVRQAKKPRNSTKRKGS
ncbi:MAG: diguanylate cyclase [Chitinivibrionales bacterium]|nr:diguanylate cyclase [Chitinivibrionales bacterium]